MKSIAVKDLVEGMIVDLESDQIADPASDSAVLANQFVEVIGVEEETSGCIAVTFADFDCVGFPPDYALKVVGNNIFEIAMQ